MRLLSIGDRVDEGRYRVHSRFERVVNLADGERLVSVVTPAIGAGPFNLVVEGIDPAPIDRVEIDEDAAMFAGRRFRLSEELRYDPAWSGTDADPEGLACRLEWCVRALHEGAPPDSVPAMLAGTTDPRPGFAAALADRTRAGVAALLGGDVAAGVRRLHGAGVGLTPGGDDFIAGCLLGCNVLQEVDGVDLGAVIDEVLLAARNGSLLVAAFLSAAAAGSVPEAMRDLVRALLGDGAPGAALDRVMGIGATSGADFAAGLLMTLQAGAGAFLEPAGRR